MRVLVTRPEPDATAQAKLLRQRGHEAVLAPLLRIRHFSPRFENLASAQGLLVTSSNALRVLKSHTQLAGMQSLPVFAVGATTSERARSIGFSHIHVAGGTARELATMVRRICDPSKGPLIHISGESVAYDMTPDLEAAGFTVERVVVYRSEAAADFPAEVVTAVAEQQIDAVMLMSRRTAEVYRALMLRHGLDEHARRMHHVCLSRSVADGLAGLANLEIAVAGSPSEEEMLALLDSRAAQSRPTCA